MSAKPLAPKQQKTLDVVKMFHEKKGYPPSLSEVAQEMGVAKPTAQSHVGKLITKGYLSRFDGRLMLGSFGGSDRIEGEIRVSSGKKPSKTTTGEKPDRAHNLRVQRNEHPVGVFINDKEVAHIIVLVGGEVNVTTPVRRV